MYSLTILLDRMAYDSEGNWRQPVDKGKEPGFSESARESTSVARGTLRELRVIGNHEARGES